MKQKYFWIIQVGMLISFSCSAYVGLDLYFTRHFLRDLLIGLFSSACAILIAISLLFQLLQKKWDKDET